MLVDAYFKGLTNIDPEKLFTALESVSDAGPLWYRLVFKQHGYIPSEKEHEAVSKVLEYAYDDWAIARLANALNKPDDEYAILQLSAPMRIKPCLTTQTGFMRGKDASGNWVTPFDPTYVEHRTSDYTRRPTPGNTPGLCPMPLKV